MFKVAVLRPLSAAYVHFTVKLDSSLKFFKMSPIRDGRLNPISFQSSLRPYRRFLKTCSHGLDWRISGPLLSKEHFLTVKDSLLNNDDANVKLGLVIGSSFMELDLDPKERIQTDLITISQSKNPKHSWLITSR
jgi:hypothetical protein